MGFIRDKQSIDNTFLIWFTYLDILAMCFKKRMRVLVFHNEKCLMNGSLFLPQLKTKLNGVLMLPYKLQNHFAPVFEKMTNYQQGFKGMLFIMDTWYDT